MLKRILILLLLGFSAQGVAQLSPDAIINGVYSAVKQKQYLHYNASMRFKFFDYDDTTDYKGDIYLQRIAKDTFFSGCIRFSTDDTFYSLYNGKMIYWVNKAQKAVTTFNPFKGETWGMDGNIRYRLVWKGFLEPESIKELLGKENKLTLLSDTTINGRDCYRVQIVNPDEDGFSDYTTILCVNKADSIPVYKTNRVKFQGAYQYFQFVMHDYQFRHLPGATFSASQIPATYKVTAFKHDKKDEKTLDTGNKAPIITGANYTKGLKQATISFADKITILDFWYMGCYPCGRQYLN